MTCIELRLVRALVGNLEQQEGKFKNSRLIISSLTIISSFFVTLRNTFWVEFQVGILEKNMSTRTNTPKPSFDPDLIFVFFIVYILFYPQYAFHPWTSAVCSLHFTLSLHFTPGLESGCSLRSRLTQLISLKIAVQKKCIPLGDTILNLFPISCRRIFHDLLV